MHMTNANFYTRKQTHNIIDEKQFIQYAHVHMKQRHKT